MAAQHDTAGTGTRKLNITFWKYWSGQTISNLGSSITIFALPLLVYKLTGSALNLGISTAANMLPYLFFGLLIGAWSDRIDRKRLMILSDIGRALVIATIPLAAWAGWLSVWWIYGVGFIQSTIGICFDSCEFAAVPSLVGQEDLVAANGRIQASYSAASILGPVLAGAAIRRLLAGEAVDLSAVPLDLSQTPAFHAKVYEIARAIPPGETLTYGQVAERLGDKLLARDVGQALGKNPWPIVVPCHRVVAAGGKLGGFSARGGVNTKLKLLAIEGAKAAAQADLFA